FAGPADRGQGAHALDGVLVVSRQRLDGQPAFATLGLALGARDGLGGRGLAAGPVGLLVGVRAATEGAAGGSPHSARDALARGPVGGGGRTAGGGGGGSWRTGPVPGGGPGTERRVADGLAWSRRRAIAPRAALPASVIARTAFAGAARRKSALGPGAPRWKRR